MITFIASIIETIIIWIILLPFMPFILLLLGVAGSVVISVMATILGITLGKLSK